MLWYYSYIEYYCNKTQSVLDKFNDFGVDQNQKQKYATIFFFKLEISNKNSVVGIEYQVFCWVA